MRKGLVALFLLLGLVGWAEQTVYRSNSTGMLLERIPSYRRDESRWILIVDRTHTAEIRRLLDDGKETRRWETALSVDGSRRVETETSGKEIVARRTWDAAGSLLQEEELSGGKLVRKTVLGYSGGKLRRSRVLAPDGAVLSTTEYLYATNGSLRQVTRTAAAGKPQISSAVTGPAGISEQRDTAGSDAQVVRYDAQGRIVDAERHRGDTLVSREELRYRADSGTLESSTGTNDVDGTVTEGSYDDAGRIATQVVKRKDGSTETVSWTRDSDGRVTGKKRESAAGVETWSYVLDAQGATTREDYYNRGALQKVTTWGAEGARTEELYSNGLLFLKIFWQKDTRVREEVYEDGAVVRERTFP